MIQAQSALKKKFVCLETMNRQWQSCVTVLTLFLFVGKSLSCMPRSRWISNVRIPEPVGDKVSHVPSILSDEELKTLGKFHTSSWVQVRCATRTHQHAGCRIEHWPYHVHRIETWSNTHLCIKLRNPLPCSHLSVVSGGANPWYRIQPHTRALGWHPETPCSLAKSWISACPTVI